MKYIVITMLFVTNLVVSQTCRLESQVPSSTPNSQFTNNGNGTILDNRTGLMWQRCQLGLSGEDCNTGIATTHNWLEALNEADSNSFAGFNDWRLPNISELQSIVEHRCFNPSINFNYFPNTMSSYFWSASPNSLKPDYAWYVSFDQGYSNDDFIDHSRILPRYVRLVRTQN